MKVYVGCALKPFKDNVQEILDSYGDGWVFVDRYVKADYIQNYDAGTLPFEYGTLEVVFSSHLLEHLDRKKVIRTLEHWFELLRSGGTLHLIVPDIIWACDMMSRVYKGNQAGGYYRHAISTSEPEHDFLTVIYGSQDHEGEYHKTGFTKKYLRWLLKDIGFVDIKVFPTFSHDMGCLEAICKKP